MRHFNRGRPSSLGCMRASPAAEGKLAPVTVATPAFGLSRLGNADHSPSRGAAQAAPRVVVHMPEATFRPPPSLTDAIAATVLPMRCSVFFMMDVLLANNAPWALMIS